MNEYSLIENCTSKSPIIPRKPNVKVLSSIYRKFLEHQSDLRISIERFQEDVRDAVFQALLTNKCLILPRSFYLGSSGTGSVQEKMR